MLSPPPLIETFPGIRAGTCDIGLGAQLRYAVAEPADPPRGTVLIAPGRREFIEKKYSETDAFLARGFRLIFFEWRGQGLSSRLLGGERHQRDHIGDFSRHIDDLNLFYDAVVMQNRTGKLILHGHSMGAHLLLRWLTERPGLDAAGAIFSAPMLAIAGPAAHASANILSWGSSKLGYGEDYAPMQHDYDESDRMFAGNPLTHDAERFPIIENYFAAYPAMAVGGVTWDWVQASIRSMYAAQRRSKLERITTPVLAILGNEDRVTPPDETIRHLRVMPKAETVIIPGARHDILNETAPIRDEAWRQIDGFLKKIM